MKLSPQFLGYLFGEPDYWAPGDYAEYNADGVLSRIESFSQQPRWHIHTKDMPFSTYMAFEPKTDSTTYIVVGDSDHLGMREMKRRLLDNLRSTEYQDPFMFHAMIVHETFLDAKTVITPVRHQLYDQLDRVDNYSKKSAHERGKGDLEELTIGLHVVSQEIDSMTAGTDMTSMIVRRLIKGHTRYRESLGSVALVNSSTKTADALDYLAESVDAQRRWLESYKARKDIAMNLVSANFVLEKISH
ncbi:hypothetical protein LTR78_003962 [Recurvomyces mirabilis]|uniref:Uncharacterized protein n=1 Tax=Recurvomyces mirabilis TaxID=574656 RepID=A0AAE1C3B9_9PEZI|nr:hypothetical protein LTR78_003962 [Recurvomyces mirabilis]